MTIADGSSSDTAAPRLRVMMAVYNGAPTLPEQLDSLKTQRFKSWDLTISDDGSTDDSLAVAKHVTRSWGDDGHNVAICDGPRRGFAQNFLSMLANLPQAPCPIALSDQDDVWKPDKLARALTLLSRVPADQPALYCSRRLIWTPDSPQSPRLSTAYRRPPSFANALIENIAPGNTIVLNAHAAALARQAARDLPSEVFAHDWWLYLVLSGAGARVLVDDAAPLLYRQHDANALGAGENLARQLANKRAVLQGLFAERLDGNLRALDAVAPLLTEENRQRLALFRQARDAHLPKRLALLRRAGVYRQKTWSTIGFWGAAVLGNI